MKCKVGKFNLNVVAEDDSQQGKLTANMAFEGYEFEITMAEVIELMTTRFELAARAVKGFFSIQEKLRQDVRAWYEVVEDIREGTPGNIPF